MNKLRKLTVTTIIPYYFPTRPVFLSSIPIHPLDELISKQILGVLWGKYNSVSYSQLLDHAAKDNPAWPYGKVLEKKLLFSQVRLKIWTCAWCEFLSSDATRISTKKHPPFLPRVAYASLPILNFRNLKRVVNVRVYLPQFISVFKFFYLLFCLKSYPLHWVIQLQTSSCRALEHTLNTV